MKANHIPAAKRIRNKIRLLENRLDQMHVPIGGGNPYWRCNECGTSDPEVSIRGHQKYCSIPGLSKQIDYYKTLLASIDPTFKYTSVREYL
jgi:hypothetical protein